MTEEDARAWVADRVSRETFADFDEYSKLVKKWQRTINLISGSTVDHIYARHIADSLQLFDLRSVDAGHWVDLGSGAGFPGLVCAMTAKDQAPGLTFTLVESDQRKASFLREVARVTNTQVDIRVTRIEDTPPQNAQIISARALASLEKLCELSKPHMAKGGIALFPKGRNHAAEHADADARWTMSRETIESKTDLSSVIYRIGELNRV